MCADCMRVHALHVSVLAHTAAPVLCVSMSGTRPDPGLWAEVWFQTDEQKINKSARERTDGPVQSSLFLRSEPEVKSGGVAGCRRGRRVRGEWLGGGGGAGETCSRCLDPYQLFIIPPSSVKYRSARAAREVQLVSLCNTVQKKCGDMLVWHDRRKLNMYLSYWKVFNFLQQSVHVDLFLFLFSFSIL